MPAFSDDELDGMAAFMNWLNQNRATVASAMEATDPDRSVRFRDIPWWEFR
jgi:hypothetical protein